MDLKRLCADFHTLYFNAMVQRELEGYTETWMGVPIMKCPLDLWVYQEIIVETKPTLIIETGTFRGGSALYFCHLFDLISGSGRVVSIDIEHQSDRPKHPRLTYLNGSSVSQSIVDNVRSAIRPDDKPMVVLDSDHHAEHVQLELEIYSPYVLPTYYLVVEDSNVSGNPVFDPRFDCGPMEAIDAFLAAGANFTPDSRREKFLLSFNPRGFLRRNE
jgi:cephalosporin hydroxylase